MNLRDRQYATSSKTSAKRLLKCFCGCSYLTVEEVKRYYRFNCRETLIDTQAAKLLRKNFEMKRRGDKSNAEQMLDVYEKCREYLNDSNLLTEDDLEVLTDLGLPYDQEVDLLKSIQSGDELDIQSSLKRIQEECCNEIEASDNFAHYKSDLLIKMNQVKRKV